MNLFGAVKIQVYYQHWLGPSWLHCTRAVPSFSMTVTSVHNSCSSIVVCKAPFWLRDPLPALVLFVCGVRFRFQKKSAMSAVWKPQRKLNTKFANGRTNWIGVYPELVGRREGESIQPPLGGGRAVLWRCLRLKRWEQFCLWASCSAWGWGVRNNKKLSCWTGSFQLKRTLKRLVSNK